MEEKTGKADKKEIRSRKKQGKTSAKMRRTVEKEPDGDLKLRN